MTKKLAEEVKKNRKPISRACKFCHSKHLQCDPGRPCQNCQKRGLESTCENVERKKTQYLSTNQRRKSRMKNTKRKSPFTNELIPAITDTASNSSKSSDLNFVNYTRDQLGKNVIPIESNINISQENPIAGHHHHNLRSTSNTPAMINVGVSPSHDLLSTTNLLNTNVYQADMTTGYLNKNKGNANPLQARRPEEHMFYNQSPSTSVETGSTALTPGSHVPIANGGYAPLNANHSSSFAETNESDSDSSSSHEPEIKVRPNAVSYHAETLDDVINKDDLNFMLNAYNKSLQESKAKFKSSLVNDEYAQLTNLLTTNPPSPSDFFDFEIHERPYIQLGDGDPTNGKAHNSIHINTSTIANSPDVLPNYIQEEHDYTSPFILRHIIKTPDDIYLTNVVKSYQYPKAYHALIHYLKQRFNRTQLLTIAKCMAAYRPSFISATKSLFENDLIFTEKSFQRSLLEYENLISLSATPTIIWRRTGEIAALTNEFSALTGYTRVNLLSKRTFIVEIMDDESALRYFKLFSDIAFGDLNATILTDCVVKKADPADGVLKCASVWTIKRDVFDIPMLIVGQFLPIL